MAASGNVVHVAGLWVGGSIQSVICVIAAYGAVAASAKVVSDEQNEL